MPKHPLTERVNTYRRMMADWQETAKHASEEQADELLTDVRDLEAYVNTLIPFCDVPDLMPRVRRSRKAS